MILILTTIHGRRHGAEELLCQLMRSWPGSAEEFALCSPAGSRTAEEAANQGLRWIEFPAKIHGAFRRHIMRYSVNRFRGLVCVSESLKSACRSVGYRTQLRTILNSIEPFPDEGLQLLEELVASQELRRRFGETSCEHFLKHFTVKRMAVQYGNFWEGIQS